MDMFDLEKINFGHIAAEEESTHLRDYFIETNEYSDVKTDPHKILVIGRKGSGKSAIYLALRDYLPIKDESVIVEALSLQDYPWQIHKKIRDIGVPDELTYINSWKYIVWTLLAKRILDYGTPKRFKLFDPLFWRKNFNSNTKFLFRFLCQNFGSISPTLPEIIADRAREVRSLSLKGVELSSFKEEDSYQKLSRSINIVVRELDSRVIQQLSSSKQYFIIFDQLDLGWDNTSETKQLITGLILAARDIVRSVQRLGKNLHVVLFLRSDIYETLRFEDKNKLSPDVVELRWDENRLQELANKRIKVSIDKSWDDIFTGEPMRQQLTQTNYIIRRTMLRPRDLIQYCVFSRKAALEKGYSKIDKESIYDAERPYSDYMRKEIQDESKGLEISVDDLFNVLQDIHSDRIKRDYLIAKFRERGIDGEAAIRQMIDLSIIGVYRAGGQSGGSTIVYKYQAQPWETLEPSINLAIHPSLKHALSLIESRAHQTG